MAESSRDHRSRINRIKKIIILSISFLLLGMLVLCIFLGVKCVNLTRELSELKAELNKDGLPNVSYDDHSGVYSDCELSVVQKNDSDDVEKNSSSDTVKKVYLTFDDGPSINTDAILDILQKYNVKATFFVVAKPEEKYLPMYQRIVDEGHSLGMHSYSHKYNEIYQSLDTFKADITNLQEFLYENTGVWSRIYRFPGGSSNTVSITPMSELIEYLNDQDIVYFDWNIVSGDAVEGGASKEAIISNCLGSIDKYDECIILMHDLSDTTTTVKALDTIIDSILKMDNTVILPITDETVPIQHVSAQLTDIEQ